MQCTHCGAENPDSFVVCVQCGGTRVVDLSKATRPTGSAPRTSPPMSSHPTPTAGSSSQTPTAGSHQTMAGGQQTTVGGHLASTVGSGHQAATVAQPGTPQPNVAGPARSRVFARDATRYLCAAVQMNAALATYAIESAIHDRHRAVAPSPGVDLQTVLKYALAAVTRQRIRDAVLAALSVILLVVIGKGAPFLVLLVLLLAWATVLAESLYTSYGVLYPELRRDAYNPANAPNPVQPEVRRLLDEIGRRDRGNVTVFPNYVPFVGYGNMIHSWAFTSNVAKAEDGKTVIPFKVSELYDHVAADVGRLGLPGVAVQNRLFVNGADLLHHVPDRVRTTVLPNDLGAPEAQIDDAQLAGLRDDLTGRARPYLTMCVTGWSGELILSIFLRFALSSLQDVLFIEASYTLLPPVGEQYKRVDHLLSSPTVRQFSRMAVETALQTPGLLLKSIPHTLHTVLAPLLRVRKEHAERREIRDERSFNYGAWRNPRELAHNNWFYRYFQKTDQEMYSKTIERRVMESITDFLSAKGIDVSELVEQRTMILNSGIYIGSGARVDAQTMAAGRGSVARTVNRVIQGQGGQKSGPGGN